MRIKYAVLIARTGNLGDNAQTQALYRIYKQMGISDRDIIFLDIETITEKIEKEVTYIVPCVMVELLYFWFMEKVMSMGCSNQFCFIPISIGHSRLYHFNEERLKRLRKPAIDQFVKPIGFRDYDSAEMYEKIGYQGYVNGCITNTFPRREEKKYDQVYVIDVTDKFYDLIPEEIKSKAVVLSQIFDYETPIQKQYDMSVERYALLRNTASLVITCRYHVAVPCAAMGIPVIMVERYPGPYNWKQDIRLPALPPGIRYYGHEDWKEIDWSPETVDYEDVKEKMIELIVSRIRNEVCRINTAEKLEHFYEPSKKLFYESIQKNKRQYLYFSYYIGDLFLSKAKPDFRYYLFGLSDRYIEQKECLLLEFIRKFYPASEFQGFVDSNKKGTHFGKEVLLPEQMQIDENTYCLVSAYTANRFVSQLFEERGFDKTHLWQMPEAMIFYVYCL